MELVLAMTLIVIAFAAVVPLFPCIRNSWDSKQGHSEALQNGRILIDHINRNLSKAVGISAVSDSSETSGHIEFEDNDGNTMRYDIDGGNYVEFGEVGSLSDLAGPVSQLQFTCYDGNDFSTATTDVNSIRYIEVQTTVTNSANLASGDKTFTTKIYLRASSSGGTAEGVSKETPYEYDATAGKEPALEQIDSTHYLCAYEGPDKDIGWAVVLTVNTGTWEITKGTAYEFDSTKGKAPELEQVDSTHYLCAYEGPDKDIGWAVILTVDTDNWTITKETAYEYDSTKGKDPALEQIDSTHYLCAYSGDGDAGTAVVLTVDANWVITEETPYEFDGTEGKEPALAKVDSTHYLCAYEADNDVGTAVVLTVNTGTWAITKETPFEFDTTRGKGAALIQIDTSHYLCAYEGETDGTNDTGWAVVLTVNTGDWTITKGTPFEYDAAKGKDPALSQINSTQYLCAYNGPDKDQGWATILTVNTDTWAITNGTAYEHETTKGKTPALSQVNSSHYLCAYAGPDDDGWSVVLTTGSGDPGP